MALEAKIKRLILRDLTDSSMFDQYFKFDSLLGKGSDGQVSGYLHRSSGRLIAVKIPLAGRYEASEAIRQEAKALKAISAHGEHEHIAHMITYQSTYGVVSCPAIFSDHAELGSLLHYRNTWYDQETQNGSSKGISERTVWKLFKDMILALNFLHNQCKFTHGDVKSDNILAFRSRNDCNDAVPELPIFKLGDFSRSVAYPSTDNKVHPWAGTAIFAPPLTERQDDEPARPAGDMWSLGATLQELALGTNPSQSRKALVDQMDKLREPHPRLDGDEEHWKKYEWSRKFCAAYRPLNLEEALLVKNWDLTKPLSRCHTPFSDVLNNWYKKLWVVDPDLRAASASLLEDLIPSTDAYIRLVGQPGTCRTDSMLLTQTAFSLDSHPQTPAHKLDVAGLGTPCDCQQNPSYEANNYPSLSAEH